jgi:hypothetical protein
MIEFVPTSTFATSCPPETVTLETIIGTTLNGADFFAGAAEGAPVHTIIVSATRAAVAFRWNLEIIVRAPFKYEWANDRNTRERPALEIVRVREQRNIALSRHISNCNAFAMNVERRFGQ